MNISNQGFISTSTHSTEKFMNNDQNSSFFEIEEEYTQEEQEQLIEEDILFFNNKQEAWEKTQVIYKSICEQSNINGCMDHLNENDLFAFLYPEYSDIYKYNEFESFSP